MVVKYDFKKRFVITCPKYCNRHFYKKVLSTLTYYTMLSIIHGNVSVSVKKYHTLGDNSNHFTLALQPCEMFP